MKNQPRMKHTDLVNSVVWRRTIGGWIAEDEGGVYRAERLAARAWMLHRDGVHISTPTTLWDCGYVIRAQRHGKKETA